MPGLAVQVPNCRDLQGHILEFFDPNVLFFLAVCLSLQFCDFGRRRWLFAAILSPHDLSRDGSGWGSRRWFHGDTQCDNNRKDDANSEDKSGNLCSWHMQPPSVGWTY